jgi:hypothetical protein
MPPAGSAYVHGVGPVGYQNCAACGARWRCIWQPPAYQRRRRRPRLLRILARLAGVAVVAVGAFWLVTRDSRSYPSHWDARVAPIASRVAALRGLNFTHPVQVNYLSGPDFEKRLATSPADLKKQRKQIDEATGLLRAAGLIGANVDLAKQVETTRTADTLAFYDFHAKAVYVRGSAAFTVETRVTLAHELTHVLQDEHFDLPNVEKRAANSKSGSSDALTALIEGDAVRIQERYLGEQSAADRQAYALLSARSANEANQRTQKVPAVVETFFSAPYIFGPQVTRVVDAGGGNAAINAALTGPTPSTRIYLDPTAVNDTPGIPALPSLRDGETKLSKLSNNDDAFDHFTLYLMLATRLDRPTALLAADAFLGGSEVTYSRSGATCFRAALVGVNEKSDAFLRSVLARWTRSMPNAGIDSTGTPFEFHSCDPGRRASTPNDAAIREAIALAVGRDAVTAELVTAKVPSRIAACAARVLVQEPSLRDELLGGKASANAADRLRQGAAAAIACRRSTLAGLP